jgi:O-antigen/teichoic acid export membrane protein
VTIEAGEPASPVGDSGSGRSIGQNVGALLSSQLFTWMLSTIWVWLVPRYLGAEAFGELSLAGSIWLIAGVFAALGTSLMTTAEVAKHRGSAGSLVSRVVRLRLAAFAVVVPVVAAVLVLADYSSTTVAVSAVAGLAALFALVGQAYESGLHGLQEMGKSARVNVIAKVVSAGAVAVVLLLGGGLIPVAFVRVLGSAVAFVLFMMAFRRVTAGDSAPSRLVGRGLLAAALPFLVVEATRVVYQQMDTIIMSLLVDSETIGWYATADTLYGSLLFIPVIVATAMFPAMADMHARTPEDVDSFFTRAFSGLLLVSVPIGLGTVLVAPSFVDLLYGTDFENAAPVLAVFGIVVILSSQTILLGRLALATDRVRFWSSLMVAITIVALPLDILLVRWADDRFGNAAIGGALAYVVTESLLITIGIWKIAPRLVTASLMWRVARCVFAGSLMLLAAWPFRDMMFVIPGAIGVVVYGVVIVVTRTLDDREVAMIRRQLGRLRST